MPGDLPWTILLVDVPIDVLLILVLACLLGGVAADRLAPGAIVIGMLLVVLIAVVLVPHAQ